MIVTEPIKEAEELAVKVVERDVNKDSNVKELAEEGQWVIVTKKVWEIVDLNKLQVRIQLKDKMQESTITQWEICQSL